MPRPTPHLPILIGIANLVLATWYLPVAISQPAAVDATDNLAEAKPAPTDPFSPISAAFRDNNLQGAERLLKLMQAAGIKSEQRSRWSTFASRVATRQGDLKWLKEINDIGQLHENANDMLILNAMRFLLAAQLDDARELLQRVKEPENLSEIPRRRYYQLWARLEQLSGNKVEEKKWLEKLVTLVSEWDQPHCQMCHSNPKQYGAEVTTFDVSNWWVGERYAVLLAADGSAKSVADTASQVLLKNDKDAAARLRRAYALAAQGNKDGRDKELRTFAWAQFPDRQIKKPLRLATFP